MAETIFYISASVFFWAATIVLVVVGFYFLGILKNFQKTSSDFKELSSNFKEKIERWTEISAGMLVLLEKFVKTYFRKRQKPDVSKKQ